MKLVTYLHNGHEQLALLVGDTLYDTDALHPELPSSMNMFLNYWEDCHPLALNCERAILDGRISAARGIDQEGADWLAPVPLPVSVRLANAAAQGLPAQLPQLRHTDHQAVKGPGEITAMPDQLGHLESGPAAAIVICRAGRNIPAEEAEAYIGGIMLLNAFRSPAFQHDETALALGPWLVTPDELEALEIPAKEGHAGKSWNIELSVSINGTVAGSGNISDTDWTFAELIERASYGRDLFPGEIIGTRIFTHGEPLKAGDAVELTSEALGVLRNAVVVEESDFSLLTRE